MSRHFSRVAGVAAVAAACAAIAPTALAAPVPGPSGNAFYSPPSSVPVAGSPGELIWYRPAPVKLGAGAPAAKAWTVLYRSSDSRGTSNFVTGTVLVPAAAANGARPLVAFAPGTQGLAKSCAPSRQLVAGTEYESPNVALGLSKGYALAVTDYAGYTNGDTPTYLAGPSEGHATLDILRAARQLPGANLPPSGPIAIWGYSQGGQAAGFAGEQARPTPPSSSWLASRPVASPEISSRRRERSTGLREPPSCSARSWGSRPNIPKRSPSTRARQRRRTRTQDPDPGAGIRLSNCSISSATPTSPSTPRTVRASKACFRFRASSRRSLPSSWEHAPSTSPSTSGTARQMSSFRSRRPTS